MSAILRIIDANFNRAREGLRVVEEYARFDLESPALTAQCKNLRHQIQLAEKLFSENMIDGDEALLNARDTLGDCGTEITTPTENQRAETVDVLRANIKRAQEALRVLAEYGKLFSISAADLLEKTRYTLYEIEPRLLLGENLRERLLKARLYVLLTTSLTPTDLLTVCREVVNGGADIIQLREKDMEDGEFYRLAMQCREICGNKVLFFVNDRPHIAQLINADGIHTGQGDLPINLTRRLIGHHKIIGKSTSAPEFAERAITENADYLGVGPVYPTNTKQHRAAVGVEYVKWASENATMPFFAIGAIKRENIDEVINAGAKRVAICTAIIADKNIAETTNWFKQKLASGYSLR